MGKPQPLSNPQDEKPSLLQSTTSAIRIQIEQLFCMQQFIKEPPVSFLRRYVRFGVLIKPFACIATPQFYLSNIVYSVFLIKCDEKKSKFLALKFFL